MNKKNKLTLKDVAQQLDVSTATISNAFNRPDQLSAARRKDILAACEKLGYHGPNRAAQILRKGESGIVAVVLADNIEYMVSDPVASTFVKGVSRVLHEKGKHLLLYSGNADSIREVADFVDGFICYGSPENSKLASELTTTAKPVVTVDFNLPGQPAINIDNEQAAYDVARQAIKPQERVAILGLKLIPSPATCRIYDTPLIDADSSISHRRLDGYKRAMGDVGVEIDNTLIWHIPESEGTYARQAAQEVLCSDNPPDTVLCMSDIIALELLQCALAKGIKVPQELKITGFDGIDEALRTRPNLTTICQPSIEKGALAAKMLLDKQSDSITMPFELLVGQTI